MSSLVNSNTTVSRDSNGAVVTLEHLAHLFKDTERTAFDVASPCSLANDYLRVAAGVYKFPFSYLDNLDGEIASEPIDEGIGFRFSNERITPNGTNVSYVQTVLGLPIWESRFTVSILSWPLRATNSASSVKTDVEVHKPEQDPGTAIKDRKRR